MTTASSRPTSAGGPGSGGRSPTTCLPPATLPFLLQTPVWCRARAAEIGPACAAFVEALLGARPLDRLRGAQSVLRLAQRVGAPRLEAACARAHAVGEYRYHTIKTILAHALDQQPLPAAFLPPAAPAVPPRHGRPWPTFFPDPGPKTGGPPHGTAPSTHPEAPPLAPVRHSLDARRPQSPGRRAAVLLRRLPHHAPAGRSRAPRPEQAPAAPAARRLRSHPDPRKLDFDFGFNPTLNKAQIFDLATCQFIARHEAVLVYGPTGVGKSHVAHALAHQACRRGYEVLCVATDKMLSHLAGAAPTAPTPSAWPATPAPPCWSSTTSGSSPSARPGPRTSTTSSTNAMKRPPFC